jgi:hypothetical protein
MTSTNLYDALEICLQTLDQGGDIESCLVRFPELANELRPILQVAVQTRSAAAAGVPEAALRRSKSRVLQAAAELREQAAAPRRAWAFGGIFRFAAASAAILAFLLTSSVGLVRASAGSLPGDGLYMVKRGWEDMRILLSDPQSKMKLEEEFEQARIAEINKLYELGRIEQVNFLGQVESQQANFWQIAGLEVSIDSGTSIEGFILPGDEVEVWGEAVNEAVKAKRILLLSTSAGPTPLPTAELSSTPQPTARIVPTGEEVETLEPFETASPTATPGITGTPSSIETQETNDNTNDDTNYNNNENGNDNNSNDDANSNDDDNSNDNSINSNEDDSNSNLNSNDNG